MVTKLTYLANLLKILGERLTLIGDFSILLFSLELAFSKAWYLDFTFKELNSSNPKSGLSLAKIWK